MTNETRKRIEAYKKALPEMQERVMAVAILLVMSISMMITASFAWITLSSAPEMTGMQTTVASNGNLEIALAHGLTSEKIEAPGESAIGDSSAAEGKTIVEANATWGNLVNVSDPTYGLNQISLRPALLSDYNLTRYPLYGASYGSDGRIVDTSDKYEYASWLDRGDGVYYFAAGNKTQYGVRAISSVAYENVGADIVASQFEKLISAADASSNEIYNGIISRDEKTATNLSEKEGQFVSSISALESLVTVFAQDKINAMGMGPSDKADTSCSPYIYYFYKMLLLFRDALDAEGEALLYMANWQAYKQSGDTNTFASVADLRSQYKKLGDYGVTLDTLEGNVSDYNKITEAINLIEPMALDCKDPDNVNNPKYTWKNIEPAVSKLLNIGNTTLNGVELNDLGSDDIGLITSEGTKKVVIHEGVLKNFEQRALSAGSRMAATVKITVKVKVLITINYPVDGVVYTDAVGSPTKIADYNRSAEGEAGGSGEAVGKDTYGMAIDVWVRTNHPNAVLTLEGSAIYEEKNVTVVDADGNEVDVYILSDGATSVEVYNKDDVWHSVIDHTEIPQDIVETAEISQKTERIIVGYQGENRVWEDWESMLEQGYIEKDATTQGAGSCYVFYANSPSEQMKILELLQSFTVAFLDQNGGTLGIAALNTESAYANQGKVTVPLEIISGTTYTDTDNKTHVGIATLEQNEPTWITAIIYLNGRRLQNENVLSSAEIQGQLNIQFGTSATLVAPKNEELQSQYRTITAEVTVGNQTSTDKSKPIQLEYDANGHIANVTLNVEGEQPERITGYFVRVINDKQGSRGQEREFRINEDGTWSAEFDISAPGNYILNVLHVDGVQYNLHDGSTTDHPANHPAIYIEGLKLANVTTDVKSGTYMSTDSIFPITVYAAIDSEIKPKQVSAVFFNENESKQYSALMTYDSGNNRWVGVANISGSDTYTLRYITVMDDTENYTLEVPVANQTKVSLYLGLKAAVYTTLNSEQWEFEMLDQDGNGELDAVTVPIYVRVWDSSGSQMKNLSDVKLYYHTDTSAMDNDGVSAMLSWTDENGGYYIGEFSIDRVGEYHANRLSVSLLGQSSPLYNLNEDAPIFTAFTSDPPEYIESIADEYQLAISKSAQYLVGLKNASVAKKVEATFTRTDGTETMTLTSSSKEGNATETYYLFDLEKDGKWKLTNVHVTTHATIYGSEFDLPVEAGVETKVVKTVKVTTYYDGAANSFASPVQMNGTFMQNQTTKEVRFAVTDYEDQPIQGLTGAVWTITHDASKQLEYGGYIGTNGNPVKANGNGTFVVENLNVSGNTVYGTEKFSYAGEYTSVVTLNFKEDEVDHSYTMTTGNPKFTVKSAKPTVRITNISNKNSSIPTKLTWSMKDDNGCDSEKPIFKTAENKTGEFSDYDAKVYAKATAENSGSINIGTSLNFPNSGKFAQPELTLKLEGVEAGWTTLLTLPAGSADSAVDFSFTNGSGSVTAKLGTIWTVREWVTEIIFTHTLQGYKGHENQNITSMTITKNGTSESVIVTLDNPLTIYNPSSMDQAK